MRMHQARVCLERIILTQKRRRVTFVSVALFVQNHEVRFDRFDFFSLKQSRYNRISVFYRIDQRISFAFTIALLVS